jgi:cytochrome c-type biogenesis protein CcmE
MRARLAIALAAVAAAAVAWVIALDALRQTL